MKPANLTVIEVEPPTEPELGASSPRQLKESPAGAGEIIKPGAIVGTINGFTEQGSPLIDYPDNPLRAPVSARTTVALAATDAGRQAVLWFEGGKPSRPIVMGLLQTARPPLSAQHAEGLVFTADREIVLRCGKASITLTRAGKVIIRGAYLLSRSSGVNRIKGGSVQIN